MKKGLEKNRMESEGKWIDHSKEYVRDPFMKKKILSLLLAVVLLASTMVVALAEPEEIVKFRIFAGTMASQMDSFSAYFMLQRMIMTLVAPLRSNTIILPTTERWQQMRILKKERPTGHPSRSGF